MPAPLWLISSCGWRFRQCKYSNSNAVARSLTNHRDSGSIFYTHMYEGRCFPAKCILAELVSWQLVMAFCMGNWTGEPESCVGNTTLLFPGMQPLLPLFCVAKSEQCNELHEIPVGGKTQHTKAPSFLTTILNRLKKPGLLLCSRKTVSKDETDLSCSSGHKTRWTTSSRMKGCAAQWLGGSHGGHVWDLKHSPCCSTHVHRCVVLLHKWLSSTALVPWMTSVCFTSTTLSVRRMGSTLQLL